jgi:SAM-dependent methyltransferase
MSGHRLLRLASLVRKARYCPLCGWRGFRFDPYGNRALRRGDAHCPVCGSLERHRAAKVLLEGRLGGGHRVLHMAPERQMIPWLVSLSSEYLNADLNGIAMVKMDLTATGLPAASKTLVWCSHVLEHIPDDAAALREIRRILAPGGLLVLQVPVGGDTTLEDPSVTTDEQRLERYLQEDHLRLYGRDLADRVGAAGLDCEILSAATLSREAQALYGVVHPIFREVFLCRRPMGA